MNYTHRIELDKFTVSTLDVYPAGLMREEYFELIWFKYIAVESASFEDKRYVYLIPPYRLSNISFDDKEGYIIAFKRDYLEEDDKEYALDVFNLFNMQGDHSIFSLNEEINNRLHHIFELLKDEFANPAGTYLVLKSLLKVLLLNLIRQNNNGFMNQDLDQKRVYHFIGLMDEFYKVERKTNFYAARLNISEKRLNQILKNKLGKTITQLLHARLILEAKRKIISSEETIKEIAFSLNFEDRGYFTRFFKKQTGQTPENFKKFQK